MFPGTQSEKYHDDGLHEIADDLYAQCWYDTEDSGEIELLKIEIMKNKPAVF